MTKLPVIDNASPEPTRRACLKGVAGFALAALGGLNQAARAAAIPEQSMPEEEATVPALGVEPERCSPMSVPARPRSAMPGAKGSTFTGWTRPRADGPISSC